jgi:hypothetical protein
MGRGSVLQKQSFAGRIRDLDLDPDPFWMDPDPLRSRFSDSLKNPKLRILIQIRIRNRYGSAFIGEKCTCTLSSPPPLPILF